MMAEIRFLVIIICEQAIVAYRKRLFGSRSNPGVYHIAGGQKDEKVCPSY
jgi:hypothetical protein